MGRAVRHDIRVRTFDLGKIGLSVYEYEQLVMGGMVNAEGCTPLGGGHPVCQRGTVAGLRWESFVVEAGVYFSIFYWATRSSQTLEIAKLCRSDMTGYTCLSKPLQL